VKRLRIPKKAVPLHPQLRNKRYRKYFEKKVAKNLAVRNKVLIFAITFPLKNAGRKKEEFFERFIDKTTK
jgi:hypothetical protein